MKKVKITMASIQSENYQTCKEQEKNKKIRKKKQVRIDTDVRISRQDIKTVIITVFHVFKMLNRDMEI